jgi:hypothetical protein
MVIFFMYDYWLHQQIYQVIHQNKANRFFLLAEKR